MAKPYLHMHRTIKLKQSTASTDNSNNMVVFRNTDLTHYMSHYARYLRALTTNATSQLDILGHDGHTLGVDSTEVGILKQANQVSFSSFLESQDSATLEAEVSLEILSDFTDQTLEGELADEQLSGLLVASDFTKSDSTRAVSVGLLHTTSSGGGFAGSLGGQLLTRSLSSS
jgi:hypothetical protein